MSSEDHVQPITGDSELIRSARLGSREALSTLLARSSPMVEAFLNRQIGKKLRRQVSIADLRQDVLMQALDGLKQLSSEATLSEFNALLRQRAKWSVLNAVRSSKRLVGESRIGEDPGRLVAAGASRTSMGSVTRSDFCIGVQGLVDGLPAELRDVVRLRMSGMPFQVIGDRLDISADVARKRFSRASRILRERAGRSGL